MNECECDSDSYKYLSGALPQHHSSAISCSDNMSSEQVSEVMEGLKVEDEVSSSDDCDSEDGDEKNGDAGWEQTMKDARIFLKTYKFPKTVCPNCFWPMYKEVLPMIWPKSYLATNPDFVGDSCEAYEKSNVIFKECRSKHGARFCVEHFIQVLLVFGDLLKKWDSMSWALPKHVHSLYSDVYMSFLRCNVYEDHSIPL